MRPRNLSSPKAKQKGIHNEYQEEEDEQGTGRWGDRAYLRPPDDYLNVRGQQGKYYYA